MSRRTLLLNCPRCGAEVGFDVVEVSIRPAYGTMDGKTPSWRAEVELFGHHTCDD